MPGACPTPTRTVPRRWRGLIGMVAVAVTVSLWTGACATNDGRHLAVPSGAPSTTVDPATTTPPQQVGPASSGGDPGVSSPDSFIASSESLAPDEQADAKFSCVGPGVSPAVAWTGVPQGTVELVVLVTDLDTTPQFVHWALAGIPPTAHGIPEGQVPPGIVQAANTSGQAGWQPFCPPSGENHRYQFTVYALSAASGITEAMPAQQVVDILGQQAAPATAFTVLFEKPS